LLGGYGVDKLKTAILEAVRTKTDCMSIPGAAIERNDAHPIIEEPDNPKFRSVIAGGTVLDVVKGQKDGTAVFVVIRQGQVSVQDAFTAGGWAGFIKKIIKDGGTVVQTASAGTGCKLILKMSPEAADPAPLGDSIFFYSKKDAETSEDQADRVRMEYSMGLLFLC
jgi:hypothetical protein